MYEEINRIIEAYRAADNTDYAILLNGEWGCGKTYYVEHELKDIVQKSGGTFIYVSLHGIVNYSQVATMMSLSSIANAIGVSEEEVRYNYWLGRALKDLSKSVPSWVKGIGSALSYFSLRKKQTAYKLSRDETLIIVDDIERALNDDARKQILGCLYEDYIRHGYRVILICDETKINEGSSYFECKEKYVRRTLDIAMLNRGHVIDFAENKCKRVDWLFGSIKTDLESFISKKEIVNLRVVAMLIDGLVDIVASVGNDYARENISKIFWSFVPVAHAVSKGLIKPTDASDYACLDKLFTVQMCHGSKDKRTGLSVQMQKACGFYDEYCEPFDMIYTFIPSLFDYAIKGVADGSRITCEIDAIINKTLTPEGAELSRLGKYSTSEEVTILECIDAVVGFLQAGKYGFSDILTIFLYFSWIKDKVYVSKWPFEENLTEMFVRYVHIREDKEPVPSASEMVSLRLHRQDYSGSDGILRLYDEIDACYKKKFSILNRKRIDNLFVALKSGDVIAAEQYAKPVDGEWRFFAEIDECHKIKDVAELPVASLSYIENEARRNILRVVNSADFEAYQIPSLKKLADYLENYSRQDGVTLSRKARIKDLVKTLRSSVNHMEEYRCRNKAV